MSHLTLPCHWDKEVIEKILINNPNSNVDVSGIYGVLTGDNPVAHGRSDKSVVNILREESIKFREFIKSRDIDFIYLLNAPFSFKDEEQKKSVREYLQWILGEFKPDALTISSLELMQFVREMDETVPIHISTIAGIKTPGDLEKYLDVRPSRVVPHHDCGKRFADLRGIAELGQAHGIEVELLSTESCLFDCPFRESHYRYLAKRNQDVPFHALCNAAKLTNPREFLRAGGIVRPEDMTFYEDLGVKHFKISGRSKPVEWLPEVVGAYMDRKYEGNLIRLLGIDPALRAEEWIYIDNKSLDGFIESYPQSRNEADEINYCNQWINRLYREGEFRLLDGSTFSIENDNLELKELGHNMAKIKPSEIKKFR